MVGIVPAGWKKKGPKGRGAEPKSLDPYLDILVDELLQLCDSKLFLNYRRAPVAVKVKLLHFVLDFPGMAKIFAQKQQGAYACCPGCTIRGNI